MPLYATDWGHKDILDVYFRGATAPTKFDVRLLDTAVPDGTKNWSDVSSTELSTAGGYIQGGESINRDDTADGFPTLALSGYDMQIESKYVSWIASANWAEPIKAVCLVADKATDQLILYFNTATIAVYLNDEVGWTIKYKLRKV